MVSSDVWLPLVTLVGGYAGSLLTEARRDHRASQREERRHRQERSASLEDRRAEFQREALLGLQDAAARVGRTAGRTYHLDLKAHRETGKPWGRTLLPDDLNDESLQAVTDFNKFVVRLLDSDLRTAAIEFRNVATAIDLTRSETEAEATFRDLLRANEVLQSRVGTALRALY